MSILLMPYTAVVGQDDAKLALELTTIAPHLGGVLLTGERVERENPLSCVPLHK